MICLALFSCNSLYYRKITPSFYLFIQNFDKSCKKINLKGAPPVPERCSLDVPNVNKTQTGGERKKFTDKILPMIIIERDIFYGDYFITFILDCSISYSYAFPVFAWQIVCYSWPTEVKKSSCANFAGTTIHKGQDE